MVNDFVISYRDTYNITEIKSQKINTAVTDNKTRLRLIFSQKNLRKHNAFGD